MALTVDASWLVDSFIYHEYLGEDRNHVPKYAEPITIEKCRISFKPVFSADKTEKQIVANGKVYCFASDTTPFKDYKVQSKLEFYGREVVITACKPYKEPDKDMVWSYEVEFL